MNVLYLGQNAAVAAELHAILTQPLSADAQPADAQPADTQSATHASLAEFEHVSSQRRALAALKRQPPHVLIVEMSAQPNSRADFLRTVRYRYPALAVVAIGDVAPTSPFEFDDWIPLPLQPFRARQAIDGLDERHREQWVGHGPLRLNLHTREVALAHGTALLKPKEAALLQLLIERHDREVTRRDIMQEIWKTSYVEDTRTLDVHIRWLRQKVEVDPARPTLLVTLRNVGYRLNLNGLGLDEKSG